MRRVIEQQALRNDRPKAAAAHDDDVEVPSRAADCLRGAVERFLQRICEEAAHGVEGERGEFGRQRLLHETPRLRCRSC